MVENMFCVLQRVVQWLVSSGDRGFNTHSAKLFLSLRFQKPHTLAPLKNKLMERREAFRFHTPFSLLVVGPSGCGKAEFTTDLLLNNIELFHTKPLSETLLLRGVARRVSTHERTGDKVS